MKSFTTAAREDIAGQSTIPFQLKTSSGEEETYETLPPTEAQIALFAAAFSTDAPEKDRMGAVMDFLRGTLSRDDFLRLRERLMDRDDELDFSLLVDIVGWLMEQMTSFPTQPSSASTPSQAIAGPRSTGRARSTASTPSTSAPAGSAT